MFKIKTKKPHIIEQIKSVLHKFWKERIADYYKKKGFHVLVEEIINGKPDIVAINNFCKMAIEIETGSSDVIKNIEKNIKASFHGIVCVATSKDVEEKIRQVLQKADLTDKVKLTLASSFIS